MSLGALRGCFQAVDGLAVKLGCEGWCWAALEAVGGPVSTTMCIKRRGIVRKFSELLSKITYGFSRLVLGFIWQRIGVN